MRIDPFQMLDWIILIGFIDIMILLNYVIFQVLIGAI